MYNNVAPMFLLYNKTYCKCLWKQIIKNVLHKRATKSMKACQFAAAVFTCLSLFFSAALCRQLHCLHKSLLEGLLLGE